MKFKVIFFSISKMNCIKILMVIVLKLLFVGWPFSYCYFYEFMNIGGLSHAIFFRLFFQCLKVFIV